MSEQKPECTCGEINARHCQKHQDPESTSSMEYKELYYAYQAERTRNAKLVDFLKIAYRLLRDELDVDSVNAIRDFIDRKEKWLIDFKQQENENATSNERS
jgi:hypothetical protein